MPAKRRDEDGHSYPAMVPANSLNGYGVTGIAREGEPLEDVLQQVDPEAYSPADRAYVLRDGVKVPVRGFPGPGDDVQFEEPEAGRRTGGLADGTIV
jgi:hypothetical protein